MSYWVALNVEATAPLVCGTIGTMRRRGVMTFAKCGDERIDSIDSTSSSLLDSVILNL